MGAPVVIVGAGFAGLAAACRLGRSGQECVVLERRERPEHGGAALVLQPNGLGALSEIGLSGQIEDECLTVPVAIQRSASGRTLARWSYGELAHPHSHIVAIGRSQVLSLLLATATAAARVETGCEVTGLVRDGSGRARGVRYRDCSGAEHEQAARWVVGADGGGSLVREWSGARLAGESGPYRYLLGISPHRPA